MSQESHTDSENATTEKAEPKKEQTSSATSTGGPDPDDPGTGSSDQTKTLLDRSAADVFLD